MAIFDEISKKITQTGQDAVQKTKNFADLTKINSMLSDEEKKLEAVYAQIGRKYFELHKSDPMPEVSELIADASQSLSKIDLYKEQVKRIKGVRDCPACGADVANDSAFCNACGYKMPVAAPQVHVPVNAVRCLTCGALEPAGRKFCTCCGSPLAREETPVRPIAPAAPVPPVEPVMLVVQEEAVPVQPAETLAPPEPVTPATKQPMFFEQEVYSQQPAVDVYSAAEPASFGKVCPNCGSRFDDDAVFCTNCGTTLGGAAPAPVAPVAPAEKRCAACGMVLEPDAAFCTNCGTRA